MKKTLIALSVAALASPFAAVAATTMSGSIELGIQGDDTDDSELTVFADNVDVLFSTSANEAGSMTGYASFELEPHMLSGTDESGIEVDAVKAGLTGGFGDISIGDVGLAVGDTVLAWDEHDFTPGTNGGIKYSNTFGPVSLGVAMSPAGNDDAFGVSAGFAAAGFDVVLGFAEVGDEEAVTGLGLAYAMDNGISAAFNFMNQDEADVMALTLGYGMDNGIDLSFDVSSYVDVETAIRGKVTKTLGESTAVSASVTSYTDDTDAGEDSVGYNVILIQSF